MATHLSMLSTGAERLQLLLQLLSMVVRVSCLCLPLLQVMRGALQLALQLLHMACQLAMPVGCSLLYLHPHISFSMRELHA